MKNDYLYDRCTLVLRACDDRNVCYFTYLLLEPAGRT